MKKRMGFLYLFFGFVFLYSPDVSIFDFLPDFIGYILILSGLSRLADIDGRAYDALVIAKRLLVLSLVKFASSLFLSSLHKTDLLLVTFSIAILDLILILPFLNNFFHSVEYTALRQGVDVSHKKIYDMKAFAVLFFVIKDVLMVVPSVVSLFDPSETGNFDNNNWYIDFVAITNILTVTVFFIMSLMFVVAFVKNALFFRYLMKNKTLAERLYDNFERSVLLVPSRMISKHTKSLFSLAVFSFVFFVDFYIDFIDVLPTFIGFFVIFLFSVGLWRKMKVKTLALTCLSFAGTVTSFASFVYRRNCSKVLGGALEYAFTREKYAFVFGVANAVLILLTLFFFFEKYWEVKTKYTEPSKSAKKLATTFLSAGIAVFNFILYVFPQHNVIFVFPSIIFAVVFVITAIDFVKGIKAEILYKYKNRDF